MTEGNPIDRAVYTFLLLLGLVIALKRWSRTLRIVRQTWPVILFFFYCLVSVLWSEYPDTALKRLNKGVGDMVMVLIVWTEERPVHALDRLLARTAYALVPMSVLLIKYYPSLGRTYGRWLGEAHYTGVTTNKNTLGALCMLLGLGTIWRLLDMGSRSMKMKRMRIATAYCLIIALIVWLLSKADSMTSLFCFLIALGLLLAARLGWFAGRPTALRVVIVMLVLFPLLVLFADIGSSTLEIIGKNSTLTDRTMLWSLVVSLTPNPIVGSGYQSFWLGSRLEKMTEVFPWVPNQAHNGYLEVFANLGWIGIGCLVLVLIGGYRNVMKGWRQNKSYSSLMLAYYVAGVLYNLTEASFFRMTDPVWLFFLLAISAPHCWAATASRGMAQSTGWPAQRVEN